MYPRHSSSGGKRRWFIVLLFLVLILLVAIIVIFYTRQNLTPQPRSLAIHVTGNQLVNAQGQPVRLVGVGRIAVYCVQPSGSIIYGPIDTTSVSALASWHINVVRLVLNEDCWLGINGVDPVLSAAKYQQEIIHYANLLHSYGIYVILDLTWNAPGSVQSTAQQVMADATHAPAFWQSVANIFKGDPATIFESYNEPYITTSNALTSNPWACLRDGCTIKVTYANENYAKPQVMQWQSAGEQSLVNAIRSTGASNPITVAGLNLANNLSELLQYLPTDPEHQLIASFHAYKSDTCNTLFCWNDEVLPVLKKIPVIATEFGEHDCQTTFVSQFMAWADSQNVSYIPWVWAPWGCNATGLIVDWKGVPSVYGRAFYNHFHTIQFITQSQSSKEFPLFVLAFIKLAIGISLVVSTYGFSPSII